MPNDFFGLPLHPLIVHATVVVVPLAALLVLLATANSKVRRWAGPLPLAASALGVILVPLSTSTGETLEEHVAETALLEKHTEMAEALLPWMIALAVVALASYVLHRRNGETPATSRAIPTILVVAALVAAAGTTVQVGRIGHSGAEAAWDDVNMNSNGRE
ncbi:putative membrane protein [Aeromicrobium panaciterrae]|uniref:Membrane protein n=1 Tax=Aeromicrobium panaciterrae TaxID=363861 RepID=A0ABU1UJ59_9ACTN|nr:DUF2231 domain-containing protein [Aeromicrobium panaciterrae]MDR7085214.1 putative membrane protein [Aeromicrobium panaciterrae]